MVTDMLFMDQSTYLFSHFINTRAGEMASVRTDLDLLVLFSQGCLSLSVF